MKMTKGQPEAETLALATTKALHSFLQETAQADPDPVYLLDMIRIIQRSVGSEAGEIEVRVNNLRVSVVIRVEEHDDV